MRLVLCDIDSTLVDSKRHLTPRTKAMIEKLHEQGIYFGIASGRPLDELQRYAKDWELSFDFDVVIGMNGSELWDGIHQKEYSYFKMKKEWIKETLDLMEVFECNPFIYRNGIILARKIDDMMLKSVASSKKDLALVKDDSEFYSEENAKIMFRVTDETMPAVEEYIAKHPSPYYNGFKTQSSLMEFADRRINKSYALIKLCDMCDFELEDVIAFGDTTNDNEMLACSGIGVCMCNGSDDTKAVADVITQYSNDEDGLAIYLEEHYDELFEPKKG